MRNFLKIGLRLSLALLFISGAYFSQGQKYIGALKCKVCHNSAKSGMQYKIWSESSHANALKSLSSKESLEYGKKNNIPNPATSPKCLKCHATTASVDKKLLEPTIEQEEGVSCESCHGPGSGYKAMGVMKDREQALAKGLILPTKAVCEKCHNKENPFHKPFDYEKAKAKIAHNKPK